MDWRSARCRRCGAAERALRPRVSRGRPLPRLGWELQLPSTRMRSASEPSSPALLVAARWSAARGCGPCCLRSIGSASVSAFRLVAAIGSAIGSRRRRRAVSSVSSCVVPGSSTSGSPSRFGVRAALQQRIQRNLRQVTADLRRGIGVFDRPTGPLLVFGQGGCGLHHGRGLLLPNNALQRTRFARR